MELNKIVIGMDFAQPSKAAAQWVASHLAPRAELLLVHCLDAPEPPGFIRDLLPHYDSWMETLHTGARTRLAEVARSIGDRRASTRVMHGRAHHRLAEVADEESADLIVVGSHGAHHGLGKLLGGTPEKLLRLCHRPLLIGRHLPPEAPHTILAAVDESVLASRVLECARFLATAHSARLIVLHAVSTWHSTQVRRIANEEHAANLLGAQLRHAREWLEAAVRDADLGSLRPLLDVHAGSPEVEIVAAAVRNHAELIVMGSRGLGQTVRPLLGSAARFIVRTGACSTLLVGDVPEDL